MFIKELRPIEEDVALCGDDVNRWSRLGHIYYSRARRLHPQILDEKFCQKKDVVEKEQYLKALVNRAMTLGSEAARMKAVETLSSPRSTEEQKRCAEYTIWLDGVNKVLAGKTPGNLDHLDTPEKIQEYNEIVKGVLDEHPFRGHVFSPLGFEFYHNELD